jgi:3-hydroxybutyryl-CoA dehydratase
MTAGDGDLFFEDFTLGARFSSPSRTLTDTHFLFFSSLTGDNHPVHYDDEYARATPFKRRVAHGLLVMSMTAVGASPLSHRIRSSVLSFSEQGCRFVKPVLIGDTVYPEHEVSGLERRGDRGIVRLTARVRNQHGDTVVEGFHVYLIRCRPTAG